jgi:hypothetical protein
MFRYAIAGLLAVLAVGQTAGKPQTYQGLEMTVTKVERASTSSLRDCPPGTNTVNAVTRPGEQFALVTVAFKVSPAFKAGPMKRASITEGADKTYSTSSRCVDYDSIKE